MADRITVSTEHLENIAQELSKVRTVLSEIGGILAGVDTSQRCGGEVRIQINSSLATGNTSAEITESLRKAVRYREGEIEEIVKGIHNSISSFTDAEKEILHLINVIPSVSDFGASGSSIGGGEEGNSESVTTREEFYAACEERRKNAIDEECAKLYDKYKKKMHIGSDTSNNGSYYQPLKNKIYINWEEDATNPRGACTTYFHETGHMIDDYVEWFGDASSSKDFSVALKKDFDNYVQKTMQENDCTKEEAYAIISDWLWDDPDAKNGLSDLCGGLSKNECVGKWGHKPSYWKGNQHGIPDKVNNEAFAHFFEASMGTDSKKLDYLKEVFPSAYKEFKKIVRKNL